MSALFTPIKLGSVEFTNRIVVVADVPVQRRRRHRHRLASRPSRHAGQFRRGPRRSSRRRMSSATAASPTAAWGSIPTTTRRRWRASSPIAGAPAPPSSASRSRTPAARPRRSGRGRAAARCRPARTRGRRSRRRRSRSGRTGTCRASRRWMTSRGCARRSSIPPSARCGSASTPSSCTTRTAIWRIRSCRRCPTTAPTSTAARWRTACGSACEIAQAVRAAVPKTHCAWRPHHRQRLARRRALRSTTR